jgi:hypothetical protein
VYQELVLTAKEYMRVVSQWWHICDTGCVYLTLAGNDGQMIGLNARPFLSFGMQAFRNVSGVWVGYTTGAAVECVCPVRSDKMPFRSDAFASPRLVLCDSCG